MRVQVFVVGTVLAAILAAGLGAVGGLGVWGVVGLVVSVLVVAQVLYLGLVAMLAAGSGRRARSDEPGAKAARRSDAAAPVPGGKLSDN